MELDSAIIAQIDKLIDDWLINDKPAHLMEMEAVFGSDGVVDATTFLAVAQRLRARGYASVSQDDRLSILVQTGLRFSIEGPAVLSTLEDYCRDDTIQDKPYTVLNKSRHSTEELSKTVVEDYNFYLKNRIEETVDPKDSRVAELLETWPQVDKAFRLIKRWTFKGKGMKIDMSMVRSTPTLDKQFLWQKKFQDHNIFKEPVRYEIEVELQRDEHTKTKEGARRCLIHGVGEILKAIQKNTFLITQPETNRILSNYNELNKNSSFRGVQPITMEVKHMVKLEEAGDLPNVRRNYNVTDKADGLRILAYCNPEGELFLIDAGMTVYKTGLQNKACPDCLLDGEWVTRDAHDKAISHVLLFDIYTLEKADVSQLPFYVPDTKETRYEKMQEWIRAWLGDSDGGVMTTVKGMLPASRFLVKLKHFEFANPANPNSIFPCCAAVLGTEQDYHTDGLILSPNTVPLPKKSGDTFWEQFKWKPAKQNTIDFLVQFEKNSGTTTDRVEVGTDPDSGSSVSYKTLRLFVGARKDITFDDPRATILNEKELPLPPWKRAKSAKREVLVYRASYFIPEDYPDVMANTCYLPVHPVPGTELQSVLTADTKEPISENMIVEMRYDMSRTGGWRWVPMRIRHDKTERYAKAMSTKGSISRTLNSELNAIGVWNSIHNPITLSMITRGTEQPTVAELAATIRKKRYYNRDKSDDALVVVDGLRNFHNHWIKEMLLYKPTMGAGGKTVLDLACGPGGDLDFWGRKFRASFVLGVDIDEDNIKDEKQGIYRRYMNQAIQNGKDKMGPMVFVQADSKLPLLKGEAAFQPEDKNILRALFARERPTGPIPPLITNKLMGKLRDGADVAVCMFALHYFLKDMETFNGFLKNLEECVKVGGYFIGCCTDGDRVFRLLADKETGESVVGKEGDSVIWSIKKGYDTPEFRGDDSSVGLPIDVKFISIGAEHTEYLVSFEYLKARLDEIGFTLLSKSELTTLPGGLQHSTNDFETSYGMVPDAATKFPMSPEVQQFSFLSRWFIFKRRGAAEAASVIGPKPKEEEEEEEEEEEGNVIVLATAAGVAAEAKAKLPLPDTVFEPSQIFQFGPEVGKRDTFELGENRTHKIVAPYWPWPIHDDEDDDNTEYPSLEHYWEAMKIKHGAKDPGLAIRLFSSETGSIRLAAKREMSEKGIRPNPKTNADKDKLSAALLNELVTIKNIMNPAALKKDNKAVVDDASWNRVKDTYYRKGLLDRWTKDKMFKRIVEKAKEQKKYMLYSITKKIGNPKGELAGVWQDNGRIDGENKIGRLLMEVADFTF